jgi:hypothetical protein
VYEQVGFIHHPHRELLGWPPVLLLRHADRLGEGESEHLRGALPRGAERRRNGGQARTNRTTIASAIAPTNYLNQPVPVLEQVLTGRYADGLGNVKNVPNRIEFDPVPWNALGVWILTQMKRWGYLKGDVRYSDIVDQVYLMTDAKKRMKEEGILAPARDAEEDRRHGQAVRRGEAGRLRCELCDPEERVMSQGAKRRPCRCCCSRSCSACGISRRCPRRGAGGRAIRSTRS